MKVLFVSLGCDKNLVDSEQMLSVLLKYGHTVTDNEEEADVIVINTCCFIHDAKQESINAIIEYSQYKEVGNCKAIIVAGCLGTRYKDEIFDEMPEIDAIIGTSSYDRIGEAIEEVLKNKGIQSDVPIEHDGEDDVDYSDRNCKVEIINDNHIAIVDDLNRLPYADPERIISTTGSYFEYLKISEGCDKNCTYCIIPKVRGRYKSYPMEYLIDQAKSLADQGVKELILVGQEITMYGIDFKGGKKLLPELITKLADIPGIEWIRLQYCYPEEITPALIETIKNEPKVCHYIDMPIQHFSTDILKMMGRNTSEKEIVKIIEKLRNAIPDICIRTTLITGFPGEMPYDHAINKELITSIGIDRLGVFTYSEEEGTPAAKMKRKVPEDVKIERRNELMQLQQKISADINKNLIGHNMTVIIDGYIPEEDVYVARSYRDAPEIDGSVFIKLSDDDSREIMSGTFIDVKITSSSEYDLVGKIISK